jgi:hypothetical protein
MRNMNSSGELFKKGIDSAFTSQPNVKLNASTMMDANNFKQGFTEEEIDENLIATDINEKGKVKGKKKEPKEATGSGSSGAFVSPIGFSEDFINKSNSEIPKKVEATEATGSGSVGAYSTTAAWAKSTDKKDWGGRKKPQYPGGAFVSVKKKCKKFPYCNKGDISALHIYKNESLKEAIKNVSNKMNISETVIKAILEYEYEKINKRGE